MLLILPAIGACDKLIIGGVSRHFGYPVDLNEKHPSIGLERKGFEYVIYKNSLERYSLAVSTIGRKPINKYLSYGARIGIATNYPTTTRVKNGQSYTMEALPLNLMPQVQAIITADYKVLSIDLGLGMVSSLVFKITIQ